MTTSIIRLFDTAEQARQARQQLERVGVPHDAVNLIAAPPSQPGNSADLDDMLASAGLAQADAEALLAALKQGGAMVSAMVEDERVEEACAAISAIPSTKWGPQRASYQIVGEPAATGKTEAKIAHDRAL